jgi:hypothetical protein
MSEPAVQITICYVLISYYGLLTSEPFSYSVVWVGIVPKPVGEGTIPRQRYRRTVPEVEVSYELQNVDKSDSVSAIFPIYFL